MANENEEDAASAKKKIDHENIGLRPQAVPITEPEMGEKSQLSQPHYQGLGNGVRGHIDAKQQGGPSNSDSGRARGVPEVPVRQHSATEGAGLADLRSQWTEGGEAIRDRRDEYADDEKAMAGKPAFLATNQLTPAQIVAKAKAEIAASKVSLQDEQHQYLRKSELLRARFDMTSGDRLVRWQEAIAHYAASSNSFFLMRAAAMWSIRRGLQSLMQESDFVVLKRPLDARTIATLNKLASALDDIQMLKGIDRTQLLQATGQTSKKVHSKRQDLRKLPPDWKSQVLNRAARSETYRCAIGILELTGIRPAELVHGVSVTIDDGKAVVRVNKGAKHSSGTGQAWREFHLPVHELPEDIREQLWNGSIDVDVSIFSAAGMRSFLQKASRELGYPVNVSAYCYRHSFAEALRENGWRPHEIGAALGHVSAETQAMYGNRIRPGKRKPARVALKAQGIKVPKVVAALPVFNLSAIQIKRKSPKVKV